MQNKHNLNDDKILNILNNPYQVTKIIQSGIDEALIKHRQSGNPICEWRNDKIVWISPEEISIPIREHK